MALIEMVVHCWAEAHPHFAAALNYQLSALVLNPPRTHRVRVSVFYTPSDELVAHVIKWFSGNHGGLDLRARPLSLSQLGRRAIGRNIACKRTAAEIVWMTDCDHLPRGDFLDRLGDYQWTDDVVGIFPGDYMINVDHKTGDRVTGRVQQAGVMDIDESEFMPATYPRAIGPVQIFRGDIAREHGYLDQDREMQRPQAKPFGSFGDDVRARKFFQTKGRIEKVDLPGLWRIRHTRTTYQEDKT